MLKRIYVKTKSVVIKDFLHIFPVLRLTGFFPGQTGRTTPFLIVITIMSRNKFCIANFIRIFHHWRSERSYQHTAISFQLRQKRLRAKEAVSRQRSAVS